MVPQVSQALSEKHNPKGPIVPSFSENSNNVYASQFKKLILSITIGSIFSLQSDLFPELAPIYEQPRVMFCLDVENNNQHALESCT